MSVQTDYYIPQMKRQDETISAQGWEIKRLRDALGDLCDAWDGQNDGGKYRGNITNAQAAARAVLAD